MASRPLVVITDYLRDELEPERTALGDVADVVALDATSEKELWGRVEEADALLVYHYIRIGSETIRRLGRCRVIVRCGVGYDNVDYRAAAERGIPVANVPDYGSEEVADSAIGMLLALTRGIYRANARLRRNAGPWSHEAVQPLHRLRGRTLGIIGLGRIGTATAIRAKALGMDVLFYDPYKPDGYDKALGIRRCQQLEELLEASFAVSLHCPLTDETRQLLNRQRIRLMPRGSYLVNTARGEVVDTVAVLEALETGHLAGAALDVLPTEPPRDDDPLIRAWRDVHHPAYERLIINPHCAFYSEESILEMRTKGALTARAALQGRPIPNVVNQSLLATTRRTDR